MIIECLRKLVRGENLTLTEAENSMLDMLEGRASASQISSFVTSLRVKGETIDEIMGAAKALKSKVQKIELDIPILNYARDEINVEGETILETIDTRHSVTSIFNVATAAMFVVAAGGVHVARFGSRSASMHFGASDVLEKLGVKPDITRSDLEKCIRDLGIGFFFMPLLHGPMKNVAAIREEIGIRTIFNLIGPLINPADASAHVLGVYEQAHTEKMADVLKNLGTKDAFVVCGAETFDEISICGPTKISRLKDGKIQTQVIEPEDFGLNRSNRESIRGGNAEENAKIIRDVLSGEMGARRDITAINAAAAFVAAGVESSLKEGLVRALDMIDSGKALQKLDELVRFTEKCKTFVRKDL